MELLLPGMPYGREAGERLALLRCQGSSDPFVARMGLGFNEQYPGAIAFLDASVLFANPGIREGLSSIS